MDEYELKDFTSINDILHILHTFCQSHQIYTSLSVLKFISDLFYMDDTTEYAIETGIVIAKNIIGLMKKYIC